VTFDWGTGFELAIPVLLAIAVALLWDLWIRPASPPRFQGYVVRQGWQVDPNAVLDRDLRNDRLTGAIVAVHEHLVRELADHRKLSRREIRRRSHRLGTPADPPVERACRAVRVLEWTYPLAVMVEDPHRTDLWSRWRRPLWRARARAEYLAALAESEAIWPALTEGS
jgi:hypothetical protein